MYLNSMTDTTYILFLLDKRIACLEKAILHLRKLKNKQKTYEKEIQKMRSEIKRCENVISEILEDE